MADFIELYKLSPETRLALLDYAVKHNYDEWLRNQMQPHWFAWLIALLQEEADNEELFPKGKWATIQRMQALLSESAREALRDAEG